MQHGWKWPCYTVPRKKGLTAGGFVGTTEAKRTWVDIKVDSWVAGVSRLAGSARIFPQTAYAGLSMSLQQEWKFLQHVTPGIRPPFVALEDYLR